MVPLSVRDLAYRERSDFADLLDGLSPAQWSADSLCSGWSVRDVVAHTLAYLSQSRRGLLAAMIRHRGHVDPLNAAALPTYARLPPDQLAALMRAGADPAGAGALYGCRVALIECLIHQQDIRRPLGLPRSVPGDRLRAALRYARASPVIGAARRTAGLRLIATDLDWSAGRGPEVSGPAEALLLAMTGRGGAVADELCGSGVNRLQ
ncbi:maleylpyruvate isomerase family mycothiol-dependent enzyme [Mycolicibacillus koreensis]|uniref:maleylpyruvate isomerase family mycothiol-dependent enzyme n=1 Tax=Mycolicibacillus koreensis TaxID=1069220 RepID=UPI00138C5A9C|nr:maleylpyruvate isomerase family mycothiol-dependent enzyme [Mycolicibacillus koreensis]BBY53662.1 hypothetical protein MKOR_09130 [Mycolicibacillus koreensis]